MPTKIELLKSPQQLKYYLYMNSFKYTDSCKGGEDSDVREWRGGQ